MRRPLVPPPVWAGAALMVQLCVSDGKPTLASVTTGALVVTASGALVLGALVKFGQQRTTVNPHELDHAQVLVTSGSNRLTRNPMYVGLAGVLVGHAVARRSVRALAPVAAYVAIIGRLQIPAEEAALKEQFGSDFDAYAQQVPRWIGWPQRIDMEAETGQED